MDKDKNLKIPSWTKITIPAFHGVRSPYDGATSVVIAEKQNIDKNGEKSMIYIVRLDKPVNGITEVGFTEDALEERSK